MEVQRSSASSDFATEGANSCLLLDALARRYGGRPSEWRRLSIGDLSFDRLCMEIAQRREAEDMRSMPKGAVQLVHVLGGR